MTLTERLQREYAGICAVCFSPVPKGKETRFRENGRVFCTYCAANHPNDYYIRVEKRLAARKKVTK